MCITIIQAMKNKKQSPENQSKDTEFENLILHRAISASNQWIMLENPDGKISVIGGAFEKMTGYQSNPANRFDLLKHLFDDRERNLFLSRTKFNRENQPRYQMQFRIRTKNGSKRWIDHQAEKYHDEGGRFLGWVSVNRDVTESNSSLLNMVCENMNEAVMVGEIICNDMGEPDDYRIVMVNKAHEKQTGLENHQLIGKRIRQIFPNIESSWIERFGKVALEGQPIRFEDYNHNTGRYYELNCHQPVHGQFAVIFTDVTTQKNIEIRLRKNEQLYQSIVNTQKELICRFRPDTTLVFVNRAYCNNFGKTEKDLLGSKFIQFIPDEAHQDVMDHIRELLATGGRKKNIHQVILPGNIIAWYEWTNYVVESGGDRTELLSVGYNITEQFNTEKQLLDTIRRFNTISEYSNTVYWEVDENGLYNYVSEGCRNIYGYSRDELVGKLYFYDLHPEENREDFKKKAFKVFEREGKFDDFHGKLITKDGELKWISTSGLPVYDHKGAFIGYRGSDMDITLRKKQQDIINRNMMQIKGYQLKLQRLNLALAESEENVKKDVAQFLHDEIGQVLSAMHIQLSFLDGNDDQEMREQIIKSIKPQLGKAIDQCREMTYELSPPVLKNYGINEAIKWKLNEVQTNHGINTRFKSSIDRLEVDGKIKLMVFRIVTELINNVVKHAAATSLNVVIKPDGKGVSFLVHDNGKGFDYDYHKDLSSNNSFGLFNIRERLSFLEGKLTIDSGKKGTKAVVFCPVK